MAMQTVLLAASYDLKIHAFDMEQGSLLSDFEISNSQANRIVPSGASDHRFYVAAYSYVFIYDYCSRNKKATHSIIAHEGNVTDLSFTSQTLVTCGDDKKIKFWDRRAYQLQSTIEAGAAINSIEMLQSGSHCVACSETGFVALYDIRSSNSCLQKISIGSQIPVRSISLSPDNTSLIAVTQDGKAICFLVTNETLTENYRIHTTNEVQLRCDVAPNSKVFVTTSADNNAKIWDLKTGDMKQSLIGGGTREWVWDAKFTADSSKLCTGSSDGVCRVWDVENGRMILTMPQLEKCVSAIGIMDV